MFKNVAAKFMVFAFDSTTNLPKTGDAANITAYVSKDYGTVTVLGDTSATEMDATNAKGYYLFDAAQGETNADCLMVSAKSSTSNVVVVGAPAVIYTRPTTGWLAPTTAGRTLDVSAGGEAGLDWANIGSPTTSVALTGTSIITTQKVDVDTIKTNPVVNGGTITFPSNATVASTTNITAGTITTVTNLTNAATAGDLTAVMKTSVTTACTASTPTAAAVTGAVGSVGTGGIAAASFAAGAIDAAAIAANAIGASEIAADAIGSSQLAATAASEIATAVGALTCTEPTAVVAAGPTVLAALSWLLTLSRNKLTQTATSQVLKADDTTTTIATSTLADDGTVFTRGEFA